MLATLAAQGEADWGAAYSAVGAEDATDRLTIFTRCAAHADHHAGQMIYLCKQLVSTQTQSVGRGRPGGRPDEVVRGFEVRSGDLVARHVARRAVGLGLGAGWRGPALPRGLVRPWQARQAASYDRARRVLRGAWGS